MKRSGECIVHTLVKSPTPTVNGFLLTPSPPTQTQTSYQECIELTATSK